MDKKELNQESHFDEFAYDWWNKSGHYKLLHRLNPIRLEYILSKCSLNKKNVLDIGCGGGLLSEPMCRLGAKVTGIDASDKNIKVAKLHSKKNNLQIDYFCSSPEKFNTKDKFDVILNMEIVEHVEDIDFFL